MSSLSPVIRPETADDVKAIHTVLAAAFEQEAEANLVDALRDADALTLSLVAERGSIIVGHVAVSRVTINGQSDPPWLGLGPIAVHPDHQRQGIGVALMLKALHETSNMGGQGLVLLGDPNYYKRFGFQPASNFGLSWEHGGGYAFQAVRLGPAAVPEGTVRCHSAFDGV